MTNEFDNCNCALADVVPILIVSSMNTFFATPRPPAVLIDPVVELETSEVSPTIIFFAVDKPPKVEIDLSEEVVALLVCVTLKSPPIVACFATPMPPGVIIEPVPVVIESVVFANVMAPIVPIIDVDVVIAFPVIDEKTRILLTVADAGPVTTLNDETPQSSNTLLVRDHIGRFP